MEHYTKLMRQGLVTYHKITKKTSYYYFGQLVHYQEYRLILKSNKMTLKFRLSRGWEKYNINGSTPTGILGYVSQKKK